MWWSSVVAEASATAARGFPRVSTGGNRPRGGRPGPLLALHMRMRIAHSWFVLSCVLLGASLVVAGQPKYGVTVETVKPAALAKAKTYIWDAGRPSFTKDVDARIVAAVDRNWPPIPSQSCPLGQATWSSDMPRKAEPTRT